MTTNGERDPDRDDPVMDWALGERLGGERPRDLVDGVRARLAAGGVRDPGPRLRGRQLLAAAVLLLGVGVVLGVALWSRGPSPDVPAQAPTEQEPKPVQVDQLINIAALPADTKAVEVIGLHDGQFAKLARLRELEVLIVREPWNESFGLSLKMARPIDAGVASARIWETIAGFSKLRRLELRGTVGVAFFDEKHEGGRRGVATGAAFTEVIQRLPMLESLALRSCDTPDEWFLELSKFTNLRSLDLSFNHGFGEDGVRAIAKCRSLRALSLRGCQQLHGNALAQLGALGELEQLDLSAIDGINWRAGGLELDTVEARAIRERARRMADRIGMGPTEVTVQALAACTKLRVLDVSGSNYLSAEMLAALGGIPSLRELDASGSRAEGDAWVRSLPPLLERLELGGEHGDGVCGAIAAHLKNLRHLTIAACYQITDRGLAAVAAMPSLRVLDMRQMRGLTVGSIATLLAAKQLEGLDVRHCDFITADHVVELRRSLPRLQRLEHSVDPAAVAAAEKMPEQLPRVVGDKEAVERYLKTGARSLDGVGFDDECLALVAKAKALENLALRPDRRNALPLTAPVTPVTDVGMRELAKIATLRGLHLDRCRQVTAGGLAVIAQLPVLEELRLSVMSVPDEFFVRLKGAPLKRLTIDGCRGFGRVGVEAIAGLHELRELSLRGCVHLDEDWISGLASLSRLERLDLSYIGSHTVFSGLSEFGSHVEPGSGVSSRAIAALAKLSTLRDLSLAYGAVDAAALRSLHAVPTLESLDLMGTEVAADDLEALPRTVTRLVLGNCRRIGQDFGTVLAKATPQLRTLVLAYSNELQDACLLSLQSVHSLRELDLSQCGKFTSDAADGLAALKQVETLTLKNWTSFGAEQWAKVRAMPNLKVLETEKIRETLRK